MITPTMPARKNTAVRALALRGAYDGGTRDGCGCGFPAGHVGDADEAHGDEEGSGQAAAPEAEDEGGQDDAHVLQDDRHAGHADRQLHAAEDDNECCEDSDVREIYRLKFCSF